MNLVNAINIILKQIVKQIKSVNGLKILIKMNIVLKLTVKI